MSMVSQAQKLTLSVMDLNITRGLAPNEVLMLTDKLLNEFVTNGIYKVVERSKRDEILKEQGFQQSGACDQGACLVEAGQLLGVQKMVGGTIGKLGTVYAVELRMMDVKTGEIDRAFSRQYSGDVSKLLAAMREAAKEFSQDKVDIQVPLLKVPEVSEGITYVSTNSQGYKEYRNEKDGSVLIEIPAGSFIMGSNESDDEKPIRTVYLGKYYVSKYEVTVGQYKTFCNATGRTMPEQPSWNNRDDHPVVQISWNDAKVYCAWAGLRLPTETEWEKAARGMNGRKYPWGNSWDRNKCNHGSRIPLADIANPTISTPHIDASEDGFEYTSPVGSFSTGVSPYGIYDMAGNVFEWCNDLYPPLDRALRGGSWYQEMAACRSANRGGLDASYENDFIGFRPAK